MGKRNSLGGINEAANILAQLDGQSQKRILEDIRLNNPSIAEEIEKKIITMDSLILMTPKMLQDFIKEVDRHQLCLSLKICDEKVRRYFLENLPSGFKSDVEDVINGPMVSKQLVEEAREHVLITIRKMVVSGSLILKENNDEYI